MVVSLVMIVVGVLLVVDHHAIARESAHFQKQVFRWEASAQDLATSARVIKCLGALWIVLGVIRLVWR